MESTKNSDELIIFNIKKFAIHDGPGIRTTTFLQGCNLNCGWCHNPEGISIGKGPESKIIKIDDLFKEIIKDKHFYETSNGGVTFSGGEPLLQVKPLTKLLEKCKKSGIDIVLDTCGYCEWGVFEKVIPFVNIFLYDLKHVNSEIHKKATGVSNELILKNLKKLDERG